MSAVDTAAAGMSAVGTVVADVAVADMSAADRPATRRSVVGGARGSVTAEFAVLMPGFVLLLVALLSAGSAATAQLRCVDAARSAARLAARHEPAAGVLAAGRSAAPSGAVVEVSIAGDLVRVRVSAQVSLPLPGLRALAVGATATARLEQAGLTSGVVT